MTRCLNIIKRAPPQRKTTKICNESLDNKDQKQAQNVQENIPHFKTTSTMLETALTKLNILRTFMIFEHFENVLKIFPIKQMDTQKSPKFVSYFLGLMIFFSINWDNYQEEKQKLKTTEKQSLICHWHPQKQNSGEVKLLQRFHRWPVI